MPRRVIYSLLLALAGTFTASAAPLTATTMNPRLQPRRSAALPVLSPSRYTVIRPATMPSPWRRVILQPAAHAISPARSGRQP
jgi:hypothetical protein